MGNRRSQFLVYNQLVPPYHQIAMPQPQDGSQDAAAMTKFSIVPTIVPTAKQIHGASAFCSLIYSVAKYNQFAADNEYSPFLKRPVLKMGAVYRCKSRMVVILMLSFVGPGAGIKGIVPPSHLQLLLCHGTATTFKI